ncbi:NAD(P)-binding protein [Lichtheimia hyalospora FSU 10163]|nr:NAD(P)-binding protein [Lichtheimia hyalospora FSU 10163]
MQERVFVIGGTGNIGERVVRQLLENNVQVTLYTRSPTKAQTMFPNATIVQGNYEDLQPLGSALEGHSRLFLLVVDHVCMGRIKGAITSMAFASGVRQVVDISSLAVTLPWRSSFLGHAHRQGEEAILANPNRQGYYVTLRPSMFMSNHLWIDAPSIKKENVLRHTADPDELEGWISTNDIADLAVRVLLEPMEKHGDGVYEITGCVLTPKERAATFSRVLGRQIIYEQISPQEKYNYITQTMGAPHLMALDIVDLFKGVNKQSTCLPILLGKEPESFEDYLKQHKNVFE